MRIPTVSFTVALLFAVSGQCIEGETINTDRLILDNEDVEMCDGLIQPVDDRSLGSVRALNGSTFTLSGGVVATGSDFGAVIFSRDSRLVIQGGSINATIGGDATTIIAVNTAIEMTGGVIEGIKETGLELFQDSQIVMSGGAIQARAFGIRGDDTSHITLKGNARVTGSLPISTDGSLTISDSAYLGDDDEAFFVTGPLRITGGEIIGGHLAGGRGGGSAAFISGGYFEGYRPFVYDNGTMVTITGGQFISTDFRDPPIPMALDIGNTPVAIFGGFFDGSIQIDGSEEVHIWGRELVYENDRLTGILADLTPIDLTLMASNVFLHNSDMIVGDSNADGRIDVKDLNNVRNHFGTEGPDDGSLAGDVFPFDGRVDVDDLNAVQNHFGKSSPTAIPEPATFVMLLLGGAAIVATRRRVTI